MRYGSTGGFGIGGGIFFKKTSYYIIYNTDFRRRGIGAEVIYRF
jgi:hypothetical protein